MLLFTVDYAVNPTLPAVYDLLSNILSGIHDATSTSHFHLGGDEVIYSCWSNDKSIVSWMAENKVASYDELLSYFVLQSDKMVHDLAAIPIHWEEVFFAVKNTKNSTYTLDMSTPIQVWTNAANIASVTADGYKVIASPSSVWYANYLDITWQTMYAYDPIVGLSAAQASLVIGGEVCLWGEAIDNSNLESVLYPRAYAVSERLWSPATVTDQTAALARMEIHRCRMLQRGFTPAPFDPSTCNILYV